MAVRTQGRKGDRNQRAGLGAQHPQDEAGGCGPWRGRERGEGSAVGRGWRGNAGSACWAPTGHDVPSWRTWEAPRGAARSRPRGRGRTCRQGPRLEREAPLSPGTAFLWTPASSCRSVSGSDRAGGAHLFNSPQGARRPWVRNQQTEPQVVHTGLAGAHRSSGGLPTPHVDLRSREGPRAAGGRRSPNQQGRSPEAAAVRPLSLPPCRLLFATGRRTEPVARGPRGALGWAPSPRLAVPTVPSPPDSLEAPRGCRNVTGAVSAALKAGPAPSRRRSSSGFPPGSSESGRHLLRSAASFSYCYFVSGRNP